MINWQRIVDRLFRNSVTHPDYIYKQTNCWIWIGALRKHRGGEYGYLNYREGGKVKHISAHRAAVRASGRELLAGSVVNHLCNNSRCVNPAHLEVTDQSGNIKYQYKEGRRSAPT